MSAFVVQVIDVKYHKTPAVFILCMFLECLFSLEPVATFLYYTNLTFMYVLNLKSKFLLSNSDNLLHVSATDLNIPCPWLMHQCIS